MIYLLCWLGLSSVIIIELGILMSRLMSFVILFASVIRWTSSAIPQLRTGTLPLAIEVGRYKGIPEEKRLCVFCDLGVVEDEWTVTWEN